MRVIFLHGKDSSPSGAKISALAPLARQAGCAVASPDFTHTRDPDERVTFLLEAYAHSSEPSILVGSSMGGYVATVASKILRPAGLFLMAPAFDLPGYAIRFPVPRAPRVAILHGWNDPAVPSDHVIAFAKEHRCELHLFDAGHTLIESIDSIKSLFDDFLRSCVV